MHQVAVQGCAVCHAGLWNKFHEQVALEQTPDCSVLSHPLAQMELYSAPPKKKSYFLNRVFSQTQFRLA